MDILGNFKLYILCKNFEEARPQWGGGKSVTMIDADFVWRISRNPLVKQCNFLKYIKLLCIWQENDICFYTQNFEQIVEIDMCALFLIAVGFIGPVILHKGLSSFYLQIMSFLRHHQQLPIK